MRTSSKVIGIVGSPRHGGNTATLVQEVLRGASSRGFLTELYYLRDLGVAPCDACDACMDTGVCIVDDGMRVLHALFPETAALVLGTPIYFDHISAQSKAFLDRLYLYTGPRPEYRFPEGVKTVLVATWEDANPQRYDAVMAWFQGRMSYYFGVETVGVLTASGANEVPVSLRSELLREAFETGAGLAKYVKAD